MMHVASVPQVYRALAVIAAEGVNHLPKYCLAIAGVLMGAAVLVNLLKVKICPSWPLCHL